MGAGGFSVWVILRDFVVEGIEVLDMGIKK